MFCAARRRRRGLFSRGKPRSRFRAARIDQARQTAATERAARIVGVEPDVRRGGRRRQKPAGDALPSASRSFYRIFQHIWRYCFRPAILHTAPLRAFLLRARERSRWSGRRDSNPRPQPWQGCALPLSYTRILFPAAPPEPLICQMGSGFAIHSADPYEIRLLCCPQSTRDDPRLCSTQPSITCPYHVSQSRRSVRVSRSAGHSARNGEPPAPVHG